HKRAVDLDGFHLALHGVHAQVARYQHAQKVVVARQNVERPYVVDGTHAVGLALKIHLERRVYFYGHGGLAALRGGGLFSIGYLWLWCVVCHYLPCCDFLNLSSAGSSVAAAVTGFFWVYSSTLALVASLLPMISSTPSSVCSRVMCSPGTPVTFSITLKRCLK